MPDEVKITCNDTQHSFVELDMTPRPRGLEESSSVNPKFILYCQKCGTIMKVE